MMEILARTHRDWVSGICWSGGMQPTGAVPMSPKPSTF